MDAPPRTHVVIIEPAAPYRRGLETAFQTAGFAVSNPSDPMAWGAGKRRRAVVYAARTLDDLDAVTPLAEAGVVVIALVHSTEPEAFAAALRAGARGVADWNDTPEAIVAIVEAAMENRVVLPAPVARHLSGSVPRPNGRPQVSAEEVEWLAAMARGTTVVALADDVGYSERAMFRKLADLYARLGARNRTEALLAADRLGLLGVQA